MIPISAGLIGFGYIYLDQVRMARRTGITSFMGQWPDSFQKDSQPWQFYFALYFYTALAYLMLVAGSILLVISLVQNAQRIGHTIARYLA